jgi:MFS family permease
VAPAAAPRTSTLAHMGRALRHRNYRLFFAGQGISLIGTWLTRVAMSWLVYRLTHSAAMLGIVGFAGQIPTFFLAPFAGVLIERWSRHRVLVWTQVLAMVQSALLAVFALTGTITVWHILVLGMFQGFINAFDTPARQTFVVEMVEAREDLPNAIALNSSMVNGARLIGPSIGGILIAMVGEGWCFAADAVSYLAVIASLLAMRLAVTPPRPGKARVLTELAEGFRYLETAPRIRRTLLLLAFVSLTGVPYMVLLPIFAGDVLHGGANTLGILMAATGAGAVSGALWLASRRGTAGLVRTMTLAGCTFGVALLAFGLARSIWLSVPFLVLAGAGMMVHFAGGNTLIQTEVSDDKRGRVMSFYTMAFFGMMPLGSLAAGLLGAHIGAPATVACGGAATLIAVLLFAKSASRQALSG